MTIEQRLQRIETVLDHLCRNEFTKLNVELQRDYIGEFAEFLELKREQQSKFYPELSD